MLPTCRPDFGYQTHVNSLIINETSGGMEVYNSAYENSRGHRMPLLLRRLFPRPQCTGMSPAQTKWPALDARSLQDVSGSRDQSGQRL